MTKEIITKIDREKGFTYRVTSDGEVVKQSYNWFTDPYTLVTITIVILGLLFYLQVSGMKTTERNFELSCLEYIELRNIWISQNPGGVPILEDILEVDKSKIVVKTSNIKIYE
jgi:hypothetical protein